MKGKSMLMNIKLQEKVFSYCYVGKLLHCYIVETMTNNQLPAYFYFRQGKIETGPGIPIFDARWEFVVNRANKEKTTFWLYCKHRKTKGIKRIT